MFRAVDGARRDPQRRAGRDGRPARPVPGDGRAPAPITAAELADRTGTAERYVREWLNAQAAGGYVEYDPDTRPLHAAARAGARAGRRDEPGVPARRLPDRARLGARRAADRRGGPQRRGRRLARARRTTSSRAASGSSGPATTPTSCRPGCRRSTASSRSSSAGALGGRRRLRARRLDDPDGAGLPALDVRRLRLPRRLDRDGARSARPRPAWPIACASRSRRRAGVHRQRLRPRDDVRLPARHGRPGRRRAPRRSSSLAPDGTWMIVEPRAGDRVEDNLNPVGRAYYGVLDAAVHAGLAVAGGRARARRAGRRGAHPRRRHGRRLHALPPRGRDAVQHRASKRARDEYASTGRVAPRWTSRGRSAEQTRARDPDASGFVERDGVRVVYERLRRRASRRSCSCRPGRSSTRAVEGAGAVPRPPLPRGHVRPARQRRARTGRADAAAYADREFAADALAVLDATGIEQARSSASRAAALCGTDARRRAPRARRRRRAIGPAVRARARPPSARARPFDDAARHRRGLGEVQPALLARATTRTSWSSSSAQMLHRAALDQADRGLRSAGRSRPTPRRWSTTSASAVTGDGDDVATLRARALPGACGPRRRGSRSSAARAWRRAGRRLTGGRLVTLEGSGHAPHAARPGARQPAAARLRRAAAAAARCWRAAVRAAAAGALRLLADRPGPRPPRPRDRARAARAAPRPRDRLARAAPGHGGARGGAASACIRPARELASESRAHRVARPASHELHVFEALRRMDEILVANFMVFHDVVARRALRPRGSATRPGRSTTSCTRTPS